MDEDDWKGLEQLERLDRIDRYRIPIQGAISLIVLVVVLGGAYLEGAASLEEVGLIVLCLATVWCVSYLGVRGNLVPASVLLVSLVCVVMPWHLWRSGWREAAVGLCVLIACPTLLWVWSGLRGGEDSGG